MLMILLTHLPVLEPKVAACLINGIPNLLRFAYVGVDIFFVLSGFLISRILIAEKTNGQLSFKRFYFKRALRVFPAYYVCLALTALLLSSDQLLPVIFYYNNYYSPFHNENPPLSHTWTLAVEEHFYLVWPMLIYFLPLKKSKESDQLCYTSNSFRIRGCVVHLFQRGYSSRFIIQINQHPRTYTCTRILHSLPGKGNINYQTHAANCRQFNSNRILYMLYCARAWSTRRSEIMDALSIDCACKFDCSSHFDTS